MITHHSEARLWLLSTPGTSYAFRLDADDTPGMCTGAGR